MEALNPIIDNLIDSPYGLYYIAFTTVLGSLVSIATVVVKFTTTTKDDEAVNKIASIIERFAFLKPRVTK